MAAVVETAQPATAAGGAGKLELLREQIRKLQAAPRRYLAVLRTGLPELDGLLPQGGLPLGQSVELCGSAASGRTSLALRAVAAAHRELRLAAWVDGPRELYPPAAAALGVDLQRLLLVRPRNPRQLVWSAQQLARSGAFACVVLDLTHTGLRLTLPESRKLMDAAVHGGSVLVLLTSPETPADGALRLRLQAQPAAPPLRLRPVEAVSSEPPAPEEGEAAEGGGAFLVEVLRSRQGGIGGQAQVRYGSLVPGGGPPLRVLPPHAQLPAAPLTPDGRGPQETPYRRVRTSELRNGAGYRGITGQRPGRDTRLPPLAPGLGTGR